MSAVEPTPAPAPAGFALTIGDIGITSQTPAQVVTPNGAIPLRGAQWMFADRSLTAERIPTWAIVCAICFAIFCLLGLLFLLVKERTTTGAVEVIVRNDNNFYYLTQIPVNSVAQVNFYRQQVQQAQILTQQANA